MIMEQVQAAADKDPDVFALFLPPASDIDINALQCGSAVILQKSLRKVSV